MHNLAGAQRPQRTFNSGAAIRRCRVPALCSSRHSDQFPLGDGGAIPRRKRGELYPSYELTREEALNVQLQALKDNDVPYADHGIEVLYRFADLDPFTRCSYFGRSLDLGQFERMRRLMRMSFHSTLLGHDEAQVTSSLELDERTWKARVHIIKRGGREEARTYEFTLVQRLGGVYDGIWFTQSLIADDADWNEQPIVY